MTVTCDIEANKTIMFFTRPTVISGNVETSFHLDSSLRNESFMNLEVTQLSGIFHKERCKVASHS